MDSKANIQNTKSRIEMLQEAWPTGDVVQPGAIDWNERVRESVCRVARTKLFLIATVFLTVAVVPFAVILPLCPLTWMAIGLWIMVAQTRRNNGSIGRAGFKFLMIGQYFNFAVSIAATLFAIVLMVEGCTDVGQRHTDIQNALFWITFMDMGVLFLAAFLRWKVLTAIKTIKNAYEGTSNDGMVSVGSIVASFALGGVVWILFGVLLAIYRKDMTKLDEDMLEQELAEAERQEITPTWKQIEDARV